LDWLLASERSMTAGKDHLISGLIDKRRKLAGIIDQLQRQLDQYRADLTHIDGCSACSRPISTRRRSSQSEFTGAIGISLGTSCRGFALGYFER
jgi:hypothetical protein